MPASKLPPVKHPTSVEKMNSIYNKINNNPLYTEEQVLDLIGKMYQDLYLWTGIDDTEWINEHIINRKL